MTFHEFMRDVQARARVGTQEEAVRATRATFWTNFSIASAKLRTRICPMLFTTPGR